MSDNRPIHEVHPELFHYTNADGLAGILRSQSLWGTHWQYLNDAGELRHFSEKLPYLLKAARIAVAEELARNRDDFKEWADSLGGIENIVDTEVQGLVELFQESVAHPDPAQQIFEFYVTSFCTPEGSFEEVRTHGLLSMWRCYGAGGYALVFDTAALVDLLTKEAKAWPARIELGDVGYSCDSSDVLDSRINALPELRKIFSETMFDSQDAFEKMLEPLMSCFTYYKHWAFAEEREVRLTTILNGERMRTINAQDGTTWRERERHNQCGAPRIHLFEDIGHRLPIKRVIVGPGPHKLVREGELRALLEELNLDIPVVLSNIPLRFSLTNGADEGASLPKMAVP
jgi:hypothetical protein